jgi:hypothetical protein
MTAAAAALAARIEALSARRLLALMTGVFVLIHAGYYLAGVRFDATTLWFYFQFLDPQLLRHRLAQSLFYLHSQPPLMNLFAGLVLKLFPHHQAAVFAAVYTAMGLGLYLALFALMRRVRVSRAVALALSTWFVLSPTFILYEQWLFYTLPVALLLTASCLLFAGTMERPTFVRAFAFFGAISALCLLRSLFHPLYLLLALAALLVLRPRHRRTFVLAALLPLLLLVGICAKNAVLFGQPAMSSWFGMNFAGLTVRAMPPAVRQSLVAEGKLTPLAAIGRMSELDYYSRQYTEVRGFEHVPALRQRRRSTGANNYNHLAYIGISKLYLKDSLYVVRHQPKYLLVGWLNAWLSYFRSGTDMVLVHGNLSKVVPLNILYDYACYGKIPYYRLHLGAIPLYYAPYSEPRLYLFLLVGLPLLLVFGFRVGWRRGHGRLALSTRQRMLVLYLCLNIAFVAAVGNAFEVGENQRFRFAADPLYVVLLGLWVEQWRRRPGVSGAEAKAVVGDTGLEPVTSCMSSKRSNQLR